MDAIKKFFDKKKSDAKFKIAGQGQSLAANQSGRSHHGEGRSHHGEVRRHPTQDTQRAGAAALSRVQKQPKEVDWSLQAIKAQARREIEAEQKQLEELSISESSAQSLKPSEINLVASPMLATQGVYFHCPLLGPEVSTYQEIKENIRAFLHAQVAEDAGISACLIIHTCNKDKEKVQVCVETLCKYIENIVSNPAEEKFKKIRMSNKAYQERIHPIEGTKEFLSAAGFIQQELPFNEGMDNFWVFREDEVTDLSTLEQLRNALVSCEPLKPQLDRACRLLLLLDHPSGEWPPFFSEGIEDLEKSIQFVAEAVERDTMLMTKAMRERQEQREMRKYRFSLIRIRFPDGLILQGTFGVYEKFSEVMKFVRENLTNDWRPFLVKVSGGNKITEEEQSLVDLHLVPAVVLNFLWDLSVQDPNLDDSVYLKPETLMLMQH
ncbi:unnamed protein product, partial [Meganyctiphanes norvegica]